MDLIGPSEVTTKGKQYTLTVICMLTNYIICVYLTDLIPNTVVNTYFKEVYSRLDGNRKSYPTIEVSLKIHCFWKLLLS